MKVDKKIMFFYYAYIAHWIRQLTYDQKVEGSILTHVEKLIASLLKKKSFSGFSVICREIK
jgi:hypothetical protein